MDDYETLMKLDELMAIRRMLAREMTIRDQELAELYVFRDCLRTIDRDTAYTEALIASAKKRQTQGQDYARDLDRRCLILLDKLAGMIGLNPATEVKSDADPDQSA